MLHYACALLNIDLKVLVARQIVCFVDISYGSGATSMGTVLNENLSLNNVKGVRPSSHKKLNSLAERQIVCRITVKNVKVANQRTIKGTFC